MGSGLLAPLLLAMAPLVAGDAAAIDAAVAAIFRPYVSSEGGGAAWDRPVFSADTTRLIAEWQRSVPESEVDDLNDGDWFCQCQDWLSLRARVLRRDAVRPGVVRARVRIDLGSGVRRRADMLFVQEGAQWKLDDMIAEPWPKGIKQALRETTRANLARRP